MYILLEANKPLAKTIQIPQSVQPSSVSIKVHVLRVICSLRDAQLMLYAVAIAFDTGKERQDSVFNGLQVINPLPFTVNS